MTLDAIAEALPAYAKPLAMNLSALAAETALNEQQKWGAFIAAGYAVGVAPVIRAVETGATEAGLSAEAKTAAKTAAAIMGINNVYFHAIHLMENPEYRALPARLRMNTLVHPGVDQTDYELWALVVSAINGCGACLDAHEAELRKREMTAQAIQAGLRIGAVVNAVSRVMAAEAAAG